MMMYLHCSSREGIKTASKLLHTIRLFLAEKRGSTETDYVSDGEVCCCHNTKTILSHILCSARLRGYQDILCVTKSDVVLNSSAPSSNSTIPHPSRKTNHM